MLAAVLGQHGQLEVEPGCRRRRMQLSAGCAAPACTNASLLPRLCTGTEEGYELYTMDHDTGGLRLDLKHSWDDSSSPQASVGGTGNDTRRQLGKLPGVVVQLGKPGPGSPGTPP